MKSEIAIIIVSYHTGDVLFNCLNAAFGQFGVSQIVLVNNGNPADVAEKLHELEASNPKLKTIDAEANIGFARACNLGAKNCQCDILVFLNPDAILDENSITKLCEDIDNNPKIIGGLIIDKNGQEQRGARRGELSISSALVSFFGLGSANKKAGKLRDFNYSGAPLPNAPTEVGTISGAFFAISTKDFNALGGFDEGYFLHVEDIDLCHRMRKTLGGKVIFNPNARAIHIGATSNAPKPLITWHKYKGFIRFFWKSGNFFGKIATILIAPILLVAMLGRDFLRQN